ncbi:MAG: methionyl-tRNA formyltransferase, partial [Bacillota bacterium]|nr:methionyl-tRNA formyltransferase [Bacillota bacterium]
TEEKSSCAPGTIISCDKTGIKAAALDKNILIEDIQMEGGKRLTVSEYIKGHEIKTGEILK